MANDALLGNTASTWLPNIILGCLMGTGFAVLIAFAPTVSLHTAPRVKAVTAPRVVNHNQAIPQVQIGHSVPVAAAQQADYLQPTVNNNSEGTRTSFALLAAIPMAILGAVMALRPSKKVAVDPIDLISSGSTEWAMMATSGPKTSLYAVVAIGGHQYVVQPGQILSVDKLPLQIGDEFSFEKVLLLKNGEKVDFGHPYLSGAKVTAEVLRNSKGKKIRIFKYRAKKHYRLTKGHRQKYTDIHITEVAGQKVPSKLTAANLVSA